MIRILFFLAIISGVAHAQYDKGNGGYSVVCRSGNGRIYKAEILDIYEGKNIYRKNYDWLQSNTFEEIIELAESRMTALGFGFEFSTELRRVFGKTSFSVSGKMVPTNDAFSRVYNLCGFEQLAIYTPSSLLISKEIYDELNDLNRAALFIHESIYSMRRKRGDLTSDSTREIVSHLLSDEWKNILYLLKINSAFIIR